MRPITTTSTGKRYTSSSIEDPSKRPRTDAVTDASMQAMLHHDVGRCIIGHCLEPSIIPWARHDNETLAAAYRQGSSLACVSKALNDRVSRHPIHGPAAASFTWLRNLNHLRGKVKVSQLDGLIHEPSGSDVRLSHWPNAQKERTYVLMEHLVWSTSAAQLAPLLNWLFDPSRGHTLASSDGRLIEPRHLPLALLGAMLRRHRTYGDLTGDLIIQIISALYSVESPSTPQKWHRAAFWAELAIGYRNDPRPRDDALNELDKLIDQDQELSRFRTFVHRARALLATPRPSRKDIGAALAHLAKCNAPLWPSSIELLENLVRHVRPPDSTAQAGDHSTLLQQLLVRYMQALNALYTPIDMTLARECMARIRADWLISAFSQLEMDDKLKIVDIFRPFHDTRQFYLDLNNVWPVVESFLTDPYVRLDLRWLLVKDLLSRLDRISVRTVTEANEAAGLATDLWDLRRAMQSVPHGLAAPASASSTAQPPATQL